MKRYGGLFDRVCSFESLLAASKKARRGKRFRASTAAFEYNLENELIALERELRDGAYRPGGYRKFEIYEPKPRTISAAPYRDRVVHHALCAIIEPILDRSLIHDAYACRTGKGTHKAVLRFNQYARKFRYVLKCDIRKYFPSIDHEILKAKLRRRIKCLRTLSLIDLIIDSSHSEGVADLHFPDDGLFTPFERKKGIPIGNLTSQVFANYYLNALDHLITEKTPRFGYVRYMDDMAVFANTKGELREALSAMRQFLYGERLRLKDEKCMVYSTMNGVNFLGYRIFPEHRRLRNASVVRYRRKLKRLVRSYREGGRTIDDVRASVHSWIGHVRWADSWGLRRKMFDEAAFIRGGM